jgi:hypothetical protein
MLPIHRITDSRARCPPDERRQFWSSSGPKRCATSAKGGIGLQTSDGPGEVRRSPGDQPIFIGLRRGAINSRAHWYGDRIARHRTRISLDAE